MCMCLERPCEHIVRRRLSTSQVLGSHQTPNLLVPWSWTSQIPELEKKMFVGMATWTDYNMSGEARPADSQPNFASPQSPLGKVDSALPLWSLKVVFAWLLAGWWASFCPSAGDSGVGLAEIHQPQWHKVGKMFLSKNTCDKRPGTDILLSNN